MKRAAAAGLLVVALALVGCGGTVPKDDLDTLAALKQECEEAGGIFETWLTDFAQYNYECDLSTKPKKDR